MKRYILNLSDSPPVTSINGIISIKRNTNVTTKGLLVNNTHYAISDWTLRILPTDYNDVEFYIRNRAVSVISGSINENTLITNDGLVTVYRDANIIEVFDLFDQPLDEEIYENIDPNGYEQLSYYNEIVNPINKRIFIVTGDGTSGIPGILSTKNSLRFIDSVGYHFESNLDYPLTLDGYGYYITDLIG
jgi:predicted house-cleaning noncanonical NTP pyrophosphatase (MazG superfamily)